MPKPFKELSEREMLSLAISQEEKHGKIYGEFAERMRSNIPNTADALAAMREHRHQLIETHRN
jgi:erythrin-vacuolar iron transport family protein